MVYLRSCLTMCTTLDTVFHLSAAGAPEEVDLCRDNQHSFPVQQLRLAGWAGVHAWALR
jgi:hypothetical protein